jgi:hypothetical protein
MRPSRVVDAGGGLLVVVDANGSVCPYLTICSCAVYVSKCTYLSVIHVDVLQLYVMGSLPPDE